MEAEITQQKEIILLAKQAKFHCELLITQSNAWEEEEVVMNNEQLTINN